MGRLLRLLGFAAGQILLMSSVVLTGLVGYQRHFIYPIGYGAAARPKSPPGFSYTVSASRTGTTLTWHAKGRPGRPAVIFMHGNATTIEGAAYITEPFRRAGWTVIIPEYPGYPGSSGKPSQSGLENAARAGWRTARAMGFQSANTLVLGNSIGSGPAITLASEIGPMGLAIISGMASMPQVIRHRFPVVPDFLIKDRYYNADMIRSVRTRTMIVHGDGDDLIPVSQGKSLARAANVVPLIVHGGHEIIGRRDVQQKVLARFDH